jgi:hypothetical protein
MFSSTGNGFGGVATGQWPALSLRGPRGQSFALQRTVPAAAARLFAAGGGGGVGAGLRGLLGVAGVVSFFSTHSSATYPLAEGLCGC